MSLLTNRKRPMHLGKYPMEKLRRVDSPTTAITDQVPRIPRRANFFVRAGFGDLGPKPQREISRFVNKYPLSAAMEDTMRTQLPLVDGEAAPDKAPLPEDSKELADHVKSLCYFLDADIVGICEVPEYAWYSHDGQGNPIVPRHKYAIVLLIDQGYETIAGSSGDDWISGAQSFRAYLRGSTIACTVANYLRRLGHEARAHTSADSQVLHLPLALLAGLGELSRIGELVLNPFLGPRFKTSVVTTNLPLAVDKPIDFGLQDFCNQCKKCARECPCGAISFGEKIMFNGYEMWKPDAESCARYRIMNPGGSACGRCMKVCPFNKPGLLRFRLALWLAIRVPPLRKFLIWLDDALKYGQRVGDWKWWFDLERRNGKLVSAPKINQRDLRPGRSAPPKHWIALYPVETNPPPDMRDPFPVDRAAARARSRPGS